LTGARKEKNNHGLREERREKAEYNISNIIDSMPKGCLAE
jgi:hypothetical protein